MQHFVTVYLLKFSFFFSRSEKMLVKFLLVVSVSAGKFDETESDYTVGFLFHNSGLQSEFL